MTRSVFVMGLDHFIDKLLVRHSRFLFRQKHQLTLGVKKKLFVSTNPTDPNFHADPKVFFSSISEKNPN